MAKNFSPKIPPKAAAPTNDVSYAHKPHLIGAVIKEHMRIKGISIPTVARHMKRSDQAIRRMFRRAYLPIPQTMAMSEVLQEELLLEYRSNVKPKPNPLQEEVDRLRSYMAHCKEVENENVMLKNKIIKLHAKIEVLEEREERRGGR